MEEEEKDVSVGGEGMLVKKGERIFQARPLKFKPIALLPIGLQLRACGYFRELGAAPSSYTSVFRPSPPSPLSPSSHLYPNSPSSTSQFLLQLQLRACGNFRVCGCGNFRVCGCGTFILHFSLQTFAAVAVVASLPSDRVTSQSPLSPSLHLHLHQFAVASLPVRIHCCRRRAPSQNQPIVSLSCSVSATASRPSVHFITIRPLPQTSPLVLAIVPCFSDTSELGKKEWVIRRRRLKCLFGLSLLPGLDSSMSRGNLGRLQRSLSFESLTLGLIVMFCSQRQK